MTPPKYSKSLFVLLVAISLCMVENSKAQITWDGGGADTDWKTSANWSGGVAPTGGASIVFDGFTGTSNFNNNNKDTQFTLITFNSTGGAFTLSGTEIEFSSGNGITDNNQTYTETVNLPVKFSNASNRSVTTVAGGTVVLGGVISGAAGITAIGGTLILRGNNTNTGTDVVNAGSILLADGAASATGAGSVSVNNTATFGGTGVLLPSVAGSKITIQSGGILAPGSPGSSAASLTLNSSGGNLTTGLLTISGATLQFNLGAGNTTSSMNLTGAFANEVVGLSGNTFNFTDLTSGALAPGEYTLFSTDSSSVNAFSGLSTGVLSGFTLNGLSAYTAAGDTAQLELNQLAGSNDYAVQLDIVAVPEPDTFALMAGGLALLGIFQFRRFQTRQRSH